jgi:hypothetical protein
VLHERAEESRIHLGDGVVCVDNQVGIHVYLPRTNGESATSDL